MSGMVASYFMSQCRCQLGSVVVDNSYGSSKAW